MQVRGHKSQNERFVQLIIPIQKTENKHSGKQQNSRWNAGPRLVAGW